MSLTPKENRVQRGDSALAVKAGFWYVISSFLVKSIAFITTPLFSRLMSSADYGEFSNFASWQMTLLIITGAELYNTLNRAYYDYSEDYDSYVYTVTVLAGIITAVSYIFFLISGDFIYNIVAIPKQYIHLLFVLLLFQSCKQIFIARERTLYRYRTVAVLSFVSSVIPTLLSVVSVILLPEAGRLSARLYGFYVPLSIAGAGCAASLLSRGRSFKWKYCKYAFALSLPLLAHYLTTYLLSSTNTIVTKSVLGAESAAVVSIANSILHILTVFFHAVSGAVTTWLMDNLNQDNKARVKKGSVLYVLLLAVVAIGVILVAPEIVRILGGARYAGSTALVPGFVLAVFIQSAGTLFTIILTYDKNVAKTAIFTGIVAVLSVGAKVVLLPIFGLNVLPYINATAFGTLFVTNYLLVKKAGFAQVVDLKKLFAVIMLVGAFVLASPFLYANNMFRYGIIVTLAIVFAVLLLKNKKLVFTFLKKMRKVK